MPIAERQIGDVTIIDLSGKLASSEDSGILKEKVTSVFFQGHKKVLINLKDLSYMDSSGLGELVSCLATARKNNGEVKLSNLGKRVQDLMIMTKLLAVFDVHDTEAGALTSFATKDVTPR
jgi:anti-sigma B factor antagonist